MKSTLPSPSSKSWHRLKVPKLPAQGEVLEAKLPTGSLVLTPPPRKSSLAWVAAPGSTAWKWSGRRGWLPHPPAGVLRAGDPLIALLPGRKGRGSFWLCQDEGQEGQHVPRGEGEQEDIEIDDCTTKVQRLQRGFGLAVVFGTTPATAEQIHRRARAAARFQAILSLIQDIVATWSAFQCTGDCRTKQVRIVNGLGWKVHMDEAVKIWIGIGFIYVSGGMLEAAVTLEYWCVQP